jgi:hypothetical protein
MQVDSGRDGERGASLVEFAIVAPLLMLLLFGIIEFGFAFRAQLTAGNAVQQAGRVGAALGNDLQTDYETLQALTQGFSKLPAGSVHQVMIFEAAADGTPKGGGFAACPGAFCNVYTYDTTNPACTWSPCPDIDNGGSLGGGWTDLDRDVALPDLDDIGVRVMWAHDWITGGLIPVGDASCSNPPSNCWTVDALFRMEPKVFEP